MSVADPGTPATGTAIVDPEAIAAGIESNEHPDLEPQIGCIESKSVSEVP